jgi:hypothetical protein
MIQFEVCTAIKIHTVVVWIMVGGYQYCGGRYYPIPRRLKQSGTLVRTYQCNKPEEHDIKV